MSFAILHMKKLKQQAIKGMQIHNQREKESQTNPDIDMSKSNLNYDLVNGARIDYNEKINARIEEGMTTGKAVRKDAVRVASFLVTSDKEFFDNLSESEEREFFATAYEYFCEEYGKENIAYAMVHKDEKTPHMHVGFVPITEDGRLSAKDFFGKKLQLVQLQDKFHKHMEEAGFDLDRGVSSSRKHVETAKFKALTFVDMEKEAKRKYEQTMGHIQQINDKTKSIENIESKKILGLVGMKENDYQSLVDYAINGAVLEIQTEKLEHQLEKSKKEVVQLKSEMQVSQDKVRNYYKEIQIENKDLKENFDSLVEKKAIQKANEKIKSADIVTKFAAHLDKYEELVKKYNEMAKTKDQSIKELTQNVINLKFDIRVNQNEIRDLKYDIGVNQNEIKDLKYVNESQLKEIGFLKDKFQALTNEFTVYRERISHVLHNQIDRIKSFLSFKNVDKSILHSLDEKREKFVEEAFKETIKPEKKVEKDQEMER